eukprot:1158536-Pelagomonas_calceolata.AAC.1
MEVLEEQLEEVSTNAAESSLAAENTAAELAMLKSSVSEPAGFKNGSATEIKGENGGRRVSCRAGAMVTVMVVVVVVMAEVVMGLWGWWEQGDGTGGDWGLDLCTARQSEHDGVIQHGNTHNVGTSWICRLQDDASMSSTSVGGQGSAHNENAHMTLTSEYRQFSADTGRSTSDMVNCARPAVPQANLRSSRMMRHTGKNDKGSNRFVCVFAAWLPLALYESA